MQKDTDEYDKRAMRFLSIALYPIVGAYGVGVADGVVDVNLRQVSPKRKRKLKLEKEAGNNKNGNVIGRLSGSQSR